MKKSAKIKITAKDIGKKFWTIRPKQKEEIKQKNSKRIFASSGSIGLSCSYEHVKAELKMIRKDRTASATHLSYLFIEKNNGFWSSYIYNRKRRINLL